MDIEESLLQSPHYVWKAQGREIVAICNGSKFKDLRKAFAELNLKHGRSDGEEYMFSDPHGDLKEVLFNLIGSGAARFKKGERKYKYYDVETGESFSSEEEFLKAHPFQETELDIPLPFTVSIDDTGVLHHGAPDKEYEDFFKEYLEYKYQDEKVRKGHFSDFKEYYTGESKDKPEVIKGFEEYLKHPKWKIRTIEEYKRYRLRVIPNIEPDPNFKGHTSLLGDLIDRGSETEECFYSIIDFTKQVQDGISKPGDKKLWGGKKRFSYIAGNHELMLMDGTSNYFNTPFPKGSSISMARKRQAELAMKRMKEEGYMDIARVTESGIIQSHTYWTKVDMILIKSSLDKLQPHELINLKSKVSKAGGDFESAKNFLDKITVDGDVSNVKYSKKELDSFVILVNSMFSMGIDLPLAFSKSFLKEKEQEMKEEKLSKRFYCGGRGSAGMLWNDPKDIQRKVQTKADLLPMSFIIGHTPEITGSSKIFTHSVGSYVGGQIVVIDTASSNGYNFGKTRYASFILNGTNLSKVGYTSGFLGFGRKPKERQIIRVITSGLQQPEAKKKESDGEEKKVEVESPVVPGPSGEGSAKEKVMALLPFLLLLSIVIVLFVGII